MHKLNINSINVFNFHITFSNAIKFELNSTNHDLICSITCCMNSDNIKSKIITESKDENLKRMNEDAIRNLLLKNHVL